MLTIEHLHLVYKVLEMTGEAGFGLAFICGGIKWLTFVAGKLNSAAESLGSIPDINQNIQTILTNHLPHLQIEATEARIQFETLRADIKGVATDLTGLNVKVQVLGTKQDDTKESLHALGQAFLAHVDKGA